MCLSGISIMRCTWDTLVYLMLRTSFWTILTNHYSHIKNQVNAVCGGCDLPKMTRGIVELRYEFRFLHPCHEHLGFASKANSDWLILMLGMPSAEDFETPRALRGKGCCDSYTDDYGLRAQMAAYLPWISIAFLYVLLHLFSLKTTTVKSDTSLPIDTYASHPPLTFALTLIRPIILICYPYANILFCCCCWYIFFSLRLASLGCNTPALPLPCRIPFFPSLTQFFSSSPCLSSSLW